MHNKSRRFAMILSSVLFVLCCVASAASPNLLGNARWQSSVDNGATWSANLPAGGDQPSVRIKASFAVEDADKFVSLRLAALLPTSEKVRIQLNGQDIQPPLTGMQYRTFAGIPASLLKKGANELLYIVDFGPASAPAQRQVEMKGQLIGLSADDLKIQTGPTLGAFDNDYFSVICRTNMPAKASVAFAGKVVTPEDAGGLFHRLRVGRVAGEGDYELIVQCQQHSLRVKLSPPPPVAPDSLTFVATGDSRTVPKDWKLVSDAMNKTNAQLLVFSGDFVSDGRLDWLWDPEFFSEAQPLVSHVPLYAVIGNHEHDATITQELFYTPSKDGRDENWVQRIGPSVMIGINGEKDFSKDSANAKWLEQQLQQAQSAKFLFVFSHYPAWSSGGHGQQEAHQGLTATTRYARESIVPLLQKYHATAFITGHDHNYERSDLPEGLIEITAGGAGAPTVPFLNSDLDINPYSKVFSTKLHYCLFAIHGDSWSMKAITPDGQTLDECGGKARR